MATLCSAYHRYYIIKKAKDHNAIQARILVTTLKVNKTHVAVTPTGLEIVLPRAIDCEGGNLRYEPWFFLLFFQSVRRKNDEVTLPLFEQIILPRLIKLYCESTSYLSFQFESELPSHWIF